MIWWTIALTIYCIALVLALLFIWSCGAHNRAFIVGESNYVLLRCPKCHVYFMASDLAKGEPMYCDCEGMVKLKEIERRNKCVSVRVVKAPTKGQK
jgi:hypothetical protein